MYKRQISQFVESTGDDFNKALSKLTSDGAKSLVLDLRNNPGGYIEAAVDVASNFVKSGEDVVYTLDKKGNREDYKSNGKQYYIPCLLYTSRCV